MSTDCVYPGKQFYETEASARAGADEIRNKVLRRGGTFIRLYPYRCPKAQHWHLSSSRQGRATCPLCGVAALPAWFDHQYQEWVIYAHGECPVQGGVKAVADV